MGTTDVVAARQTKFQIVTELVQDYVAIVFLGIRIFGAEQEQAFARSELTGADFTGIEIGIAIGIECRDVVLAPVDIERRKVDRGIYRQDVNYIPRTLGLGTKSWQANINVRIIIQACDYTSGRNCEVLLETRVKNLLKVLFESDFISYARSSQLLTIAVH